MKAELCKTCIHTNVCMRDKNIVGDRFVMGHPMVFDNDELFKRFKEWEAKGFPCDEYLAEPIRHGHWVDDNSLYKCSVCGEYWSLGWASSIPMKNMLKENPYCSHCGAKMDEVEE